MYRKGVENLGINKYEFGKTTRKTNTKDVWWILKTLSPIEFPGQNLK
jgi:hypothetical protein